MGRELIKTEYHNGYELCYEWLSGMDYGVPETEGFVMVSAFTPTGAYIGDENDAIALVDRGIKPELANPTDNVCSVGFCEADQKWYGWSHRAMSGFGVGDKMFVDFTDALDPLYEGTITSLEEARQSAANFADAVG